MNLSRDVTLWIHFFFDQCLPPLLRDSKWFMWLPFKLLFGKKAEIFFQFKAKAPYLSQTEFRQIYQDAASVFIQRETDLNQACISAIEQSILGNAILDIACGRGFLAKLLAQKHHVTAADIVIAPSLITEYPHIQFQETNLENLPFENQQFDTVICAHTLEHVQNITLAIQELRRVTKQRLIIVVPKQRPYQYTFDLHLHFFPYAVNLLTLLGKTEHHSSCQEMGGDWFYMEDKSDK